MKYLKFIEETYKLAKAFYDIKVQTKTDGTSSSNFKELNDAITVNGVYGILLKNNEQERIWISTKNNRLWIGYTPPYIHNPFRNLQISTKKHSIKFYKEGIGTGFYGKSVGISYKTSDNNDKELVKFKNAIKDIDLVEIYNTIIKNGDKGYFFDLDKGVTWEDIKKLIKPDTMVELNPISMGIPTSLTTSTEQTLKWIE